ncbi:MAG TPA: SCP2 sterol-binding domain-containing protein [Ktedonobacterales bacterium]
MATEHPQMQAQQLAHAAEVGEIRTFFDRAKSAAGDQPRLRGVTGVCQFEIEGAGVWRIAVKDGQLTVTEGQEAATPPTAVISITAHDFLRIVHRENHLNIFSALMQGLFTVSGDAVFAGALLTSTIWPSQTLRQ